MPVTRLPGHAYWLRRSVVIYDERHARLFGATAAQAAATSDALRRAYAARSPESAARAFQALGATIVIVPTRSVPGSWNRSGCFSVLHRDPDWLAARVNSSCQAD